MRQKCLIMQVHHQIDSIYPKSRYYDTLTAAILIAADLDFRKFMNACPLHYNSYYRDIKPNPLANYIPCIRNTIAVGIDKNLQPRGNVRWLEKYHFPGCHSPKAHQALRNMLD